VSDDDEITNSTDQTLHDEATSAPSGTVHVVSTTDAQSSVTAAAKLYGHEEVVEGEEAAKQVLPEVPRVAVSEVNADTPEQLAETERAIEETQQQRRDEYLGLDKRVQRQLRQISRLPGQRYEARERIAALEAELAQYRTGQQPPQQAQPQEQNGDERSELQQPRQQQQQQQPPPPSGQPQFTQKLIREFERRSSGGMATFPYR